MLHNLNPGKVFLDYGPMQMTIAAYLNGQPLQQEVEDAAQYAKGLLTQLTPYLPVAKMPIEQVRVTEKLPLVLRYMIEGVRSCNDSSLTPMAAVAGSFSDAVADYLVERGASKVIVNNGGDIALRLGQGESTRVGIASHIKADRYTHILEIDHESNVGGITTSGIGGRSFTKGIASATVALGINCRVPDACATLIGNYTYSPDPGIKQVLAETLDPATDLKGHLVTAQVGNLQLDTPVKALGNGVMKAKELIEQQIILGAILFVDQHMEAVPLNLKHKITTVD